MKRVNDNKYGYRSWTEEDIKRFARFLVLPLLVLILVIVILIVDRKNHPKPEETVLETESSSAAEADSGETEESSQQEFTVGSVPEVEALVNQYFAAKQNADAEGIYQMFGWTDTAGIDELRRQLQYDARYTEGYRNIVCYTSPGAAEGAYLVYVTYDLKFKDSLTLAPGILWNYIKAGEDGVFHLTESGSLDEAELAFIAEAERKDEIVLMKTEIYAKLRQALETDELLAESYSILERQGGAAADKAEETQHEVTVQIGQ